MTLPAPNAFSGKAQATTLAADITNTATSFTVTSASTWTQTVGPYSGQPLGYNGTYFVITLDYGLSTEEKVLCTGITGSGPYTISVYNSGGETGRGYDGTSAVGHYAATPNQVVAHTYSADVPYRANLGVTNAATADAKAVTAQATADAATTTANAALPKAGGTMSGAIAMGSNKITGLTAGSNSGDAVNYTQFSPVVTSANGKNLTGVTPLTGTNPTYPATLINYTFTTTVTANSGGSITVNLPTTFANSILGATATMCYTGTWPGAYCVMDATTTLSTIVLYLYKAGGTAITSGTYRVNVTVCGY